VNDVKHRDLIKLFEKNGWYFLREGANHDIYTDGKKIEPIPRHREINEKLAKALIRKHGLK
jgi:predicted RNA binding protein YcfA (HicA-like mRNA interferase family)